MFPGSGRDPDTVIRNWPSCLPKMMPKFGIAKAGLVADCQDVYSRLANKVGERLLIALPCIAGPIAAMSFAKYHRVEK